MIGVSGYVHRLELLLEELSPVAKEQKFLITHGTEDPLIPFLQVKAQFERLKRAGIQVEWHEFRKAHTIAGDEELNVIRHFVKSRFGPGF